MRFSFSTSELICVFDFENGKSTSKEVSAKAQEKNTYREVIKVPVHLNPLQLSEGTEPHGLLDIHPRLLFYQCFR
jgi:hypothetical protein